MKDILVLGDDCVDRNVVVDTSRPNPEKLDQKVWKEIEVNNHSGMMLNVRDCLKNLGLNVKYRCAGNMHEYRTTKTRYFDEEGKLLARFDQDRKHSYNTVDLMSFLENSDYDAVVIADYNKGAINEKILRFIDAVVDDRKPIFLDSKRTDLYKFPTFKIKINDAEAQRQEKPLPPGSIVTLGGEGAYEVGTKPIKYYHAPKVNVLDVCGAGDAFMAGYVYGALLGNIDPIIYGICNGSISVQYKGCYRPTHQELMDTVYRYMHGDNYKEIK